jgi:hypothetical protein
MRSRSEFGAGVFPSLVNSTYDVLDSLSISNRLPDDPAPGSFADIVLRVNISHCIRSWFVSCKPVLGLPVCVLLTDAKQKSIFCGIRVPSNQCQTLITYSSVSFLGPKLRPKP